MACGASYIAGDATIEELTLVDRIVAGDLPLGVEALEEARGLEPTPLAPQERPDAALATVARPGFVLSPHLGDLVFHNLSHRGCWAVCVCLPAAGVFDQLSSAVSVG